MLNYIWLGLIVLGIAFAVGSDCVDQAHNTYRNGDSLEVVLHFPSVPDFSPPVRTGAALLSLPAVQFEKFYRLPTARIDTIRQWISVSLASGGRGTFRMTITDSTPRFWRTMASAAGSKDQLSGKILVNRGNNGDGGIAALLLFDPVTLPKIRAVTQAVLEYAGTAVTIALGLIGIMALWLGIMKVAESAGLITVITRWLSPLMTRLFPDVPKDHPAMGAMVMNIAATMLGLSNAATPFGLKAMEELETINPRKGVATNAMVTFLAINTAGFMLIPATALAVRVGLGSANPTVIVGTTIFGGLCATIAGIATAKILQRLPIFSNQTDRTSGPGHPSNDEREVRQ